MAKWRIWAHFGRSFPNLEGVRLRDANGDLQVAGMVCTVCWELFVSSSFVKMARNGVHFRAGRFACDRCTADARRSCGQSREESEIWRSWEVGVVPLERIFYHPASLARFARSLGGVVISRVKRIRRECSQRERSEREENLGVHVGCGVGWAHQSRGGHGG